jgi:phage N-6-adenine-methyltransferase
MNLDKIAAANKRDYEEMQQSLRRNIERVINIGDRLIIALGVFDTNEEFSDWLGKTHPFGPRQSLKYIRIATHKVQARIELLQNPDLDIGELQKLLPHSKDEPVETEADPKQMAYVGSVPGIIRDADNWHTPIEYIEAARLVLGTIDLDPFSDEQANTRVKATRILTQVEDAFTASWADPEQRTVWMNPPYGAGSSSKAVDKFIEEYNYGSFDEAIVLMNSSTDTNWFHRLATLCSAICFTKGRISFIDGGGKKSSGNTKGQVFFYIGRDIEKFRAVFSNYGLILPHSSGGSL